MASYPTTFPQVLSSDEAPLDDLTVDRAVNGSARVRAFYDGPKRKFVVKHWLNATDWATLWAFYVANRKLAITFTWAGDGVTYTCLFAGPPTRNFSASPVQADVVVNLVEQ